LDSDSENAEVFGVLAHPTTVHVLSVLSERSATAGELAAELDCPLRHVSAHLAKLEELGLVIEVAGEGGKGGSAGKRYRSRKLAWIDREAWEEADRAERPGVTAAILGLVEKDLAEAVAAGTLDGDENHISRTPLLLDAEGYEELVGVLDSALEAIVEVQERAKGRIEDEDEAFLTVVHLLQCDLPPLSPDRP